MKRKCSKCNGKGHIALGSEHAETLALLAGERKTITAVEGVDLLLKRHGHILTANALNNRLRRLQQWGLLTRERDGKEWVYSRIGAHRAWRNHLG